jgi:hypothetical protein
MTHKQKVEHLIADLRKHGVGPYTVAPPVFRLLWALGIRVPPPLFLGFLTLTVVMGLPFGLLWGAAMWLLMWRDMAPGVTIIAAAAAGLLFGLGMAAYCRWQASHLQLPSWKDYGSDALGPAAPTART